MNPRALSTPLITITFFFLSLFIFIKLAGPIPFSVDSVNTNKSDVFSVTDEGTSNQKPDLGVVSVGVQSDGATVKAAQDGLNGSINKVSASIKALGVDTKDIQTQNYSINPKYDYTAGQKITGYIANTNLSIKIRNLENVNRVIDAATASGANQIGGVQFEVEDRVKAEDEARQAAVAKAKKKAEDAAKIAGFKLGRLINYSEDFGGVVPRPMLFDAVAAGAPEKSTQVEPGSNEIKITVTLSYQIL